MKRKWLIGLALVLCLGFAGCGDEDEDEDVETKQKKVEETVEEETKEVITVEVPKNIHAVIDGEYLYVEWDEVKGVTGYELKLNDSLYERIPGNHCVPLYAPGTYAGKVKLEVRAYKDADERFYSDWATMEIDFLKPNLQEVSIFGATLLSRNGFEEWLAVNKKEYEITEQETFYIYCVKEIDEVNDGRWNKIKRGGAAAWKSFWEGFSETVDNETADGETIVKGILENRGLKNYIKDVDESATFEGGWRAIKAAWNAMKIDGEYVYYFYFPKDSDYKACSWMERHFLLKNHENYEKAVKKDFSMTEVNGMSYYTMIEKTTKRKVLFDIGKETVQGVDRWVDYYFPINLEYRK